LARPPQSGVDRGGWFSLWRFAMKTRHFLAWLALVGVAILGVVGLERRHQDRALAQLRNEVAAVAKTADPDAPRANPSGAKYAAFLAMAAVATAQGGKDAGVIRPPAPMSPERQAAEAHERFEEAYAHDPPDPAWSARARTIADSKLPSLLPSGSVVRSFDCHSEICRLETGHKDYDSYMKFIHQAFLTPADALWNAATYSTPVHDNPEDGLMVTYIAREGHTLPSVVQ
jgi:hypothetical protein